jgi:hypothetical protein
MLLGEWVTKFYCSALDEGGILKSSLISDVFMEQFDTTGLRFVLHDYYGYVHLFLSMTLSYAAVLWSKGS